MTDLVKQLEDKKKGCGTIVELFCGTKSFTKEAEKLGYKCFTIDFNKKFNPNLVKDILELTIEDLPEEFRNPTIVWASPPCTEYSHAKRRGIRNLKYANKVVLKTLELIKQLNPKIWILENPQTGLLKFQKFMKDLKYTDASYCKYGYPYRKQTRFWNNFGLSLKTCDKDCDNMNGKKHKGSAGNGRIKYTDKNYNLTEKYSIPPKLCIEILNQIKENSQAEIAILEQAIAEIKILQSELRACDGFLQSEILKNAVLMDEHKVEMQKQRQEEIGFLYKIRNDEAGIPFYIKHPIEARIEQLNQPKTEETYTDTVNNTVKSCRKMFQPFLSSDEFYNDEETFWKCGDLWNEKPLLCPDCKKLKQSLTAKENSKQ